MEFELAELAVGGGHLALSSIPGRGGDYAGDLLRMQDWRPDLVLTMVETTELERVGALGVGTEVGTGWLHFPVADFGVPDGQTALDWSNVSVQALLALRDGGRVLVHCFGGCGRSGMAVLRLMIEAGEAPAVALARLRAVRPCAVETETQRQWALGGMTVSGDFSGKDQIPRSVRTAGHSGRR